MLVFHVPRNSFILYPLCILIDLCVSVCVCACVLVKMCTCNSLALFPRGFSWFPEVVALMSDKKRLQLKPEIKDSFFKSVNTLIASKASAYDAAATLCFALPACDKRRLKMLPKSRQSAWHRAILCLPQASCSSGCWAQIGSKGYRFSFTPPSLSVTQSTKKDYIRAEEDFHNFS